MGRSATHPAEYNEERLTPKIALSGAQRNLEGYRLLDGTRLELAGLRSCLMRFRFMPVD